MAAVIGGADPAEERAQSWTAITIRDVCTQYLENPEAGTILRRKHRPIKASTLAMDRSRIETHIVLPIGTRQVRALRIADIEKIQMDIVTGKTAKPRKEGGRGGKAAGKPCTRRLSGDEIRALGEAMEIAERSEKNPTGLAAVRALLLQVPQRNPSAT